MTNYLENKVILNVYAPINNASKLVRQTKLQDEINKSTLHVETSALSFSN